MDLSASTLGAISSRVAVPNYERARVGHGIVHIGVGAFNRSHLAVYLDELLQSGRASRWGECGIGLLPPDERLHEALLSQNCLYGLMTCGGAETSLRIVGSLIEHLYGPKQTEAALERMSSPECTIVSLTVTEGGYFVENGSKRFKASDANILHDLQFRSQPTTFLGYLAEAAHRRCARGIGPFTVLSCDNLEKNGDTARTALLAFSEMRDPKLRRWIDANVSFPNSMVDRITPGTTDENRQSILEAYGIRDQCPVVAEPFCQWVLEDNFINDRPAFEDVGAIFTSDVSAFEKIKMRLLNGGHSAIAYLAALLGIDYVCDAMADNQLEAVLGQFLDETSQVLHDVPGLDINSYKKTIVERFANPFIRDSIMRIASEGTAKLAKFIVPAIHEHLASGSRARFLPLTLAAWLCAMLGNDELGRPISIRDSAGSGLTEFIRNGGSNARIALSSIPGFGELAGSDNPVAARVDYYLQSLRTSGVRPTLDFALSGRPFAFEA